MDPATYDAKAMRPMIITYQHIYSLHAALTSTDDHSPRPLREQ